MTVPYIDSPSPPPFQEKSRAREPICNCMNLPYIIHELIEPLTYRRDNYAHFLSEDCERANSIIKLLMATECLI